MKEFESSYHRLKYFLGLMVIPSILSAQNIPSDSPLEILKQRQEVFRQLEALQDPFEDSLWCQGRIYDFQLRSNQGTPYFNNSVSLAGSLTYKGKLHEDLVLSYNLITDELILLDRGNTSNIIQIELNKYYVDRFSLNYHGNYYHFRMHSEMKPIHDQMKEGFYEVIYDDVLRMFVKHKKILFFDVSESNPNSYKYEKQVYLILNGDINVVKSRRDYLKAFQQQKKPLRKYMRRANINFEKSGTQILTALCAYSKSLLDQ